MVHTLKAVFEQLLFDLEEPTTKNKIIPQAKSIYTKAAEVYLIPRRAISGNNKRRQFFDEKTIEKLPVLTLQQLVKYGRRTLMKGKHCRTC